MSTEVSYMLVGFVVGAVAFWLIRLFLEHLLVRS